MEIKKSTINNIGIVIIILIVLSGSFVLLSTGSAPSIESGTDIISFSGDKQMINLTAKGGYSPSVITAAADKETILLVSTNNTFDCSSALTIPKLGIQKNLPATGKTEIALGSQRAGTEINGTCSMGMYSFKIKFS